MIEDHERIQCVIAPPEALEMAILHHDERGMVMDSSWRNKNAYQCPLTLLGVVNEYHHLIPGRSEQEGRFELILLSVAAMVSHHADHEAYEYLLAEFKAAVKQRASDILAGQEVSIGISDRNHGEFMENCRMIADSDFIPCAFMIDGDEAERSAIRTVWPDMLVRMCQFHIIQALRKRLRQLFGRRKDAQWISNRVLDLFRKLQRCSTPSVFDDGYKSFRAGFIETTKDTESWVLFHEYLTSQWLSPRWIDAVMDWGLPTWIITRDGPFSTNNFVERMFRTFDKRVLACRVNRR